MRGEWIGGAATLLVLAGCANGARVSYVPAGQAGDAVVMVERRAEQEREYIVLCHPRRDPPCVRVAARTVRGEDLHRWMESAGVPRPADTVEAPSGVTVSPGERCRGARCGRLRLVAHPWCMLELDGRSLGRTPILDFALEPGRYEGRCRNPETGIEEQFGVAIEPRRTTSLRIGIDAIRR